MASMREILKRSTTNMFETTIIYLLILFYGFTIRKVNRLKFINRNDTTITYMFDRLRYQRLSSNSKHTINTKTIDNRAEHPSNCLNELFTIYTNLFAFYSFFPKMERCENKNSYLLRKFFLCLHETLYRLK